MRGPGPLPAVLLTCHHTASREREKERKSETHFASPAFPRSVASVVAVLSSAPACRPLGVGHGGLRLSPGPQLRPETPPLLPGLPQAPATGREAPPRGEDWGGGLLSPGTRGHSESRQGREAASCPDDWAKALGLGQRAVTRVPGVQTPPARDLTSGKV